MNQNHVTTYCIDVSSYLLRERSDIPATDAFQISDLNLKMLELNHSNSVKSDIEEHQSPLEERIDSVGYNCQTNSKSSKWPDIPPAT